VVPDEVGPRFEHVRPTWTAPKNYTGAEQACMIQVIVNDGVDKTATRRTDMTLAAFFEQRYRDDDKDGAWHLRG